MPETIPLNLDPKEITYLITLMGEREEDIHKSREIERLFRKLKLSLGQHRH
jgi:hypothetical protein